MTTKTSDTIAAEHRVSTRAQAFVDSEQGLRIGHDTERSGSSGEVFESIDPATESVLGKIAGATTGDVASAVRTAKLALSDSAWSVASAATRGKYLLDLADAVDEHADILAELETLDMGKPREQALGDMAAVAACFRYYAGWPTKLEGSVDPVREPYFGFTQLSPIGVCGAITPWNFPLVMASHKIGPALAAGNSVVLKPAEDSSYSALYLADLAREIGLPAGVLNVVPGSGAVAGAALVEHPDVAKISFTGSTPVGRAIVAAAGRSMKKVAVELGGKTPNIVFPDADIDAVAAGSAEAVWENAGQVCIAPTRLFLHEDIYDEALEKLTRITSGLRVADPLSEGTDIGPLVSKKQYDSVLGYIRIARDEGATIHYGGEALARNGFFVQPTIVTDVHNSMRVAREEIFGPVLTVLRFTSEDEVVRLANDSDYDLSAAVWTKDITRALRMTKRLDAGTVWVNTSGRLDPAQSFGGYSKSGNSRELGRDSVMAYTRSKSVMIDLT